ncbi:MAG: thioredoxin fold domain-containing protein [Hyphomicrobiaceae bacterium]|nr:thioredoxin fold domain-containing protein [Hyphomicrobiaceae bacterium]
MRRLMFWTCVFAALGLLAARNQLVAAYDAMASARAAPVELLVFEHPDCQYCRVFRRDVLPRYQEGTVTSKAPLRFIDLERTDTAGLGLRGGVHVVPTFVLMQNGREVDRIVGYWAPENFFRMLSHILERTDLSQAP